MTTPSYRPLDDKPDAGGWQPYPKATGPEPSGPPPSRTLAVWCLVLGWVPFLPCWVASVVMAVIVFDRSKSGQDHGRKVAIGGLVGVAVWVAIIVGLFFARPFAAHRSADGEVSKGGSITIAGLQVGDCGEQLPTGPTNVMHVVPCGDAHRFQVMATFDLSGDYPGDAAVEQRARAGCLQRLRRITALSTHPDLRLSLMRPVAESWTRNKEVVCMAQSDQSTTGSLLRTS